ncbi:uncharacterized protein LOC133926335 [Phragmites australis]|uniref:uncharacterized protein LOC133926335 n=1 Tax=Phragmites australis TaxID=29695 RepID=UPI002D77868D|nr:uncharacterized protein LOC133926335 [Phragmites australis]
MAPPATLSVARQVEEIAADPDRASAYARLLHLQRGCADDPSAAADLAAESPSTLLPRLLRDAAEHDEAVAASSLKCLGFALYHPVLVSTISAQMSQLILDTLVQLIMNTRMKSACNLGVWCISVQQLEPLIIEDQAEPVLTAIVHALDNPFGSLSTTFEAAQAIIKLAGQSPNRMRDLSSLWVPPIYRRLLSADKPERDMAERCLIKVSGVILPPQPLLSKVVASDLKQKLLSRMMNMLDDHSKKVQAVKSWGWIISLLGSCAVSNTPLLNKLLKVPEQMFIDLDPQVQIATVASWRNLVDAFFPSQATETVVSPFVLREHASAQVKRIRLLMVPLCRVMSRSHNIVLCSSCLSTWHYLLHKLGDLINHLPILEAAFGPILKIVFSFGINDMNKPLWSFCINLFHDFISLKIRHRENFCTPVDRNLLAQSCMHLKALLDVQHIKWLPWDISCFHFHLEILGTILNPELFQDMIPEMMVIVMDSATRIFRFLLQGVIIELKAQHAYEQVSKCITNMCKFVKKFFLDHVGKHNGNKSALLLQFGLRFVKVIVEGLDHSLLASEKFKICLDIEHTKEKYAECSTKVSYPGIRPLPYKEMVSPAVYMTALSLSMVAQFTGELSHGDAEQLASILSSSDILENFSAAVSFMYMQIRCPIFNRPKIKWLMLWNKIAKHFNKQITCCLKISPRSSRCIMLYQFLCYPFFALLYPGGTPILPNAENRPETYAPITQDLEVELASEVYRSLSTNSICGSKAASEVFLEGFYEYFVSIIDENMSLFQDNLEHCSEKFQNTAILSALGEVVIGLLQNDRILNYCNQGFNETNEYSTGCRQPNLFLSCLKIVDRVMKLSSFGFKANPTGPHQVINRVFSSLSTFVGHLESKKDIILLFEIIGDQLTEWLSLSGTFYCEMQKGETIDQLEKLWVKTVECLKMSQLISDGSFLPHQQLLEVALNHPHHPILAATASVWRPATYGNSSLQHPGCLASKLDELLMSGERAIASNETEHSERDGGSLKISVGLGRKRLKITKYSTKLKELGKNAVHLGGLRPRIDTSIFSPHCMENNVCRKPELILEMLKRKR